MKPTTISSALMIAAALIAAGAAQAQPQAIDTAKSSMTVHVYKAGALSAFGHDHEISAPIARGEVDVKGQKVQLRVEAGALKVRDPKVSDKDRGEIQATMLGPEVLAAEQYKEISFQSTSVEAAGPNAWKVTGNLTLHGATKPVSMEVHGQEGHYTGACRLNMTEFGIKPVKVAGGAVKVKEELEIAFDIQLAR